jgi:large subunit ribosomal protein L4
VAVPKAPVLGGTKKEVSLDEAVFGAEPKPHLVHEAVRAEMNARRQGTRAAKSRGLVSGGRAKPWRQKGTGRARQGTIRAPQFAGGGVAFPPTPRSFEVKVNKKAARAAMRSALSDHAQAGTLGVLDASKFDAASTKAAAALLADWGKTTPTVLIVTEAEETLIKSFRNLDRVLVTVPTEVEVAEIVWARSLLVSEAALPLVQARAPVVSEKSYGQIAQNRYTFKVHQDAHKTQVRQAVEELFDVKVLNVAIIKVPAKPKRRGQFRGIRPGWKKAVVQLKQGDSIEIFEGAQL